MRNAEAADLLERIGLLLEASGEPDRFKIVAYRRAATSIRNLGEDVEEVWKRGQLTGIQYVGDAIAKKLDEYFRTGRLEYLEKLEKSVPKGAPDLMRVQGIGPKTAYKLAHDYRVKSVEELAEGIKKGRLDAVFGEKVRADVLKSIERLKSYQKRMLLPEAEGHFEMVSAYFASQGVKVTMAGSLRRGKSTVGDLDILSTDSKAIAAFSRFPKIGQMLESGTKRASAKLDDGVQVDVRVFTEEEYGAAMVYFTGSKEHNVALRNIAIEKGWKLNEYGLFDAKSDKRVGGETEEDVYARLGMAYIPPELRENRGEIAAAKEGKLPNLIRFEDLKGDLQMHSTWSDGNDTLEAMATACKERGYEYMAITDHSVSVGVANGLSEERFRNQWKEVEKLNDRLAPFRILRAVELEIRGNGTLDFGDAFLKEFDLVGASLHQNFKQSAEKLTERAVRALSDPEVDYLCHPTNRLIGRREGNPVDLERIVRTARENGKMLEIDGEPQRLDLDEVWARRAMEEGVPIVVDSDAHTVGELDNVGYGVTVARRGWLEAKDVVNTKSLRSLLNATARASH